jgi:hypothetical protein
MFINDVVNFYQRKLNDQLSPYIVYAWVDEMAGQLRFSAISGRDTLPFECSIVKTTSEGEFAHTIWRLCESSDLDHDQSTDAKVTEEDFKLTVFAKLFTWFSA